MLTEQQRRELDWEKTDGLMPVIHRKRQSHLLLAH